MPVTMVGTMSGIETKLRNFCTVYQNDTDLYFIFVTYKYYLEFGIIFVAYQNDIDFSIFFVAYQNDTDFRIILIIFFLLQVFYSKKKNSSINFIELFSSHGYRRLQNEVL